MLFKVWWEDLRKAVTDDSTQGTLVYTAEYQGAGTSLSIFSLFSGNFTGFHTHWRNVPAMPGVGFKWLVHYGGIADLKLSKDSTTQLCEVKREGGTLSSSPTTHSTTKMRLLSPLNILLQSFERAFPAYRMGVVSHDAMQYYLALPGYQAHSLRRTKFLTVYLSKMTEYLPL